MYLQKMVNDHFNRKKVKALTINVMGITGLIIAALAILFAQDQAILLSQISYEITHSPLGSVFTTVKTLF